MSAAANPTPDCIYCKALMFLSSTPAGEACYECSQCGHCAMIGTFDAGQRRAAPRRDLRTLCTIFPYVLFGPRAS
jgi:hypothetical protein